MELVLWKSGLPAVARLVRHSLREDGKAKVGEGVWGGAVIVRLPTWAAQTTPVFAAVVSVDFQCKLECEADAPGDSI